MNLAPQVLYLIPQPILSWRVPINKVVVWLSQIVKSVNRQTLSIASCRPQFALLVSLIIQGLKCVFDSQQGEHHFALKLSCKYIFTLRKNRLTAYHPCTNALISGDLFKIPIWLGASRTGITKRVLYVDGKSMVAIFWRQNELLAIFYLISI